MSAPRWRVAGAALALSFACGQADREDAAAATPFELTPAPVRAPSVALGDGHEVINLADSFLRYASAAQDLGNDGRRALWDTMLEAHAHEGPVPPCPFKGRLR